MFFGFKVAVLKMRGVSHKVVLLSLLLLFVYPCVPARVEREESLDLLERDDGGDVHHQDNTPAESQQTLIKHGPEDGVDTNEETKQKDGQAVRFEPPNIDFSGPSLA